MKTETDGDGQTVDGRVKERVKNAEERVSRE